jgi:DNA-binding response OmpR family regulator
VEETKILIIEDEPELASALALRLEKAGYSVSIAHDGEEGLVKMSEERPSLVILDVILPGINGYEVCRRIRSDKRYEKTVVVMLTVRFQEEDVAEGYRVGADEYVTKPFEWEDLLERIERFVGPKARILVCDDEPDIVRALEIRLKDAGYEVVTASDGDEFLERARSSRPDLAILDILMPKRDGFEACRRLKEEVGSDIPVIVLTVKSESGDISKGLEVGADAYITKPFDQKELLQRVRMLLESRPRR